MGAGTADRYLSAVVLSLAASAAASGGVLDPSSLTTSIDGPKQDLQSLISSAGYSSSVHTDQSAAQLFSACEPVMRWSIAWQSAAFAPRHRLGWYAPDHPEDIRWVIGGSESGLMAEADVAIDGPFGLAFDSGDAGLGSGAGGFDLAQQGTVYYSQEALNPGGADLLADVRCRTLREGLLDCGLIVSWEDFPGFDHDYNDFGLVLRSVVPSPGAMALLALGVLTLAVRRRA